ncbi:hypothetical protein LXL04_036946 [Taraxacum kok-saghyz]
MILQLPRRDIEDDILLHVGGRFYGSIHKTRNPRPGVFTDEDLETLVMPENFSMFLNSLNGFDKDTHTPNREVGSGSNTSFWHDKSAGDSKLKEEFPELYKRESKKRCKVEDRFDPGGVKWEWKSIPTSAAQIHELASIESKIENFQPTDKRDQWTCVTTQNLPQYRC